MIGASKIARDITEHKRIQSALRESEMMRRLVETQESERARIARDLHDHIGQMLTGLRLKIERLLEVVTGNDLATDQVVSIREIAARMDRDVGFLSRELRPRDLDQRGLDNALGAFVTEWSAQFGIDAEFKAVKSAANGSGNTLPREVETNVYRITQEALNNVVKHADAMHVSVLLHLLPDSIALAVEDDGCGFDAERPNSNGPHGYGLIGMRERTELLGGSFDIESSYDNGTSILVRIPLDSNGGPAHA